MSQNYSRSPFQQNYAGAQEDELYTDFFPTPSSPITSAPNNVFASSFQGIHTENLENNAFKPVVQNSRYPMISGPLADVPTTQSLIAALQATMPTTSRQPVVIPGTKRSGSRKVSSSSRLHPRFRVGVTLVSLFIVLVVSLVTLTPLGRGQSGVSLLGNLSDWVHAGQVDLGLTGQNAPVAKVNRPLPAVDLPVSQYITIARQDALDAGIPPDYFVRQINQESHFNPNAMSPAGAVGIAQFIPTTAAELGFNPYDPIAALKGAANYMSTLYAQYGNDYAKALAAYNGGPGVVDYAVNACGGGWLNCLPGETRAYINIIMGI